MLSLSDGADLMEQIHQQLTHTALAHQLRATGWNQDRSRELPVHTARALAFAPQRAYQFQCTLRHGIVKTDGANGSERDRASGPPVTPGTRGCVR